MRVTVFGGGAIGSVLAGHLARAGRDVVLVDTWYRHLEMIRRYGLEVETFEETFRASPRVLHLDRIAELGATDVLVLAVKSYDTPWVAHLLREHLAPGGVVLSAQNGMNEQVLVGSFGQERTIGCVVPMGAECFTPGRVRRTTGPDWEALLLGELDGSMSGRVAELRELFDAVGTVAVTDEIHRELWGKLTLNVMSNSVGGLTGRTTKAMWTTPPIADCLIAMAHESIRVATAAGITVAPVLKRLSHGLLQQADHMKSESWHEARSTLNEIGNTRSGNKENLPSLLHDVIKGRRTEIDYLNGWIVRAGREHGVPTPVNETCVELVHDLEIGGEPGDERLEPLVATVRRHYDG